MSAPQIIPTILQNDLEVVKKQIALAQQMPGVSVVQIDILDGQMTEERTIGLGDLSEIEYGDLQLDVHLLTEEPMDFVWELIEMKEFLPIHSVTAQIERMSYQADFLEEVKKHEWKAGLSLELYTPFEEVADESWKEADIIQLMAIQIGSQGQTLKEMIYERLDGLTAVFKQQNYSSTMQEQPAVWIDGGVRPENILKLASHGATGVTVGSHFWRAADPLDAYRQLRELL